MIKFRCAKGATLRIPYAVQSNDGELWSVSRCAMRKRNAGVLEGLAVDIPTEARAATATIPAGFNAVLTATASSALDAGEYQLDAFISVGSDIMETEPILIVIFEAASSE